MNDFARALPLAEAFDETVDVVDFPAVAYIRRLAVAQNIGNGLHCYEAKTAGELVSGEAFPHHISVYPPRSLSSCLSLSSAALHGYGRNYSRDNPATNFVIQSVERKTLLGLVEARPTVLANQIGRIIAIIDICANHTDIAAPDLRTDFGLDAPPAYSRRHSSD